VPGSFLVDDTADPHYLRTIGEALGMSVHETREEHRTWYDTHDWRLFRAGLVLAHRRHGHTGSLDLADREGRRLAHIPATGASVTVDDLPPGPVGDRVRDAAGIRALLPRAADSGPVHTFSVQDCEEQTVAVVEGPTRVEGAGGIGVLVRVEPLRGHAEDADRATRRLARLDALRPTSESPLARACAALGLTPGHHLARPDLDLAPDEPAGHAFARAFAQLLAILRDNLDGTLEQLDTEFLHDYRVAVRRSRAVARFARGHVPDDVLSHHAEELRWLGGVTSPSRDLDVHALGFDELAALVGDPHDLDPFRDLLGQRRTQAHRELGTALRSRRHTRLLDTWASQLAVPAQADETTPVGEPTPAGRAADQLLARAWRKAQRRGNAVTDQSPPEAVHDLRKRCKELRYLLEVFGSLYDADHVLEFVGELKKVQANLGDFQDAEALKLTVATFAEDLTGRDAPAATLLAMGRLEEQLEARQLKARRKFARRWQRFDRRHTQRLVEQMVEHR
jgi:CHAD domain-containing protein